MIWITEAVVFAIHDEQLAEHGGAPGIRDRNVIQSALARPQNLLAYGDPDFAALAAAYAFGFAQIHGFVDGNKRVSLVVSETFLLLNGYALDASDAACLATWMALASGALSEQDLAGWLRDRLAPL